MIKLQPVLIPRQLSLLIILSTGLLSHVMLIPDILQAAGRDGWVSVLTAVPFLFLIILVIKYTIKNSPKGGMMRHILTEGRPVVRILFFTPICLFLFISAYITFIDLVIWLQAYFLADVSRWLIMLLMGVSCFIFTWAGVKYMAVAAGLLLPIVMLLGIFIAITNTDMKDFSLLFPILSEGWSPVLKGSLYVLSGFLELYLILLLHPFSEGEFKLHHLLVLGLILFILIMGPLSAAIMEFGPSEAASMRYPAYDQWRIMGIGEFITHMDFFALYQWLCGALIRIGLFLFLLGSILNRNLRSTRVSWKVVVPIYLIFFMIMWINVDTYHFYYALYHWFFPATVALFSIYILATACYARILAHRKRGVSS
ncbi:endospore germination permease [Rossellomorea marisflavi]|uniref:Spore gernimation protein n=1 Tax=Rossellomorea marisflavi TaxID=189381 RepID=A0A163JNE2_9BACI|nr:endospore germination permease [Rossellomorea marisflavi]KZE45396.1 spore gernimation protein [Rossellomorea marisflavi]